MTKTCSVCGQELDPNPRSGPAHARKHKNQFRDLTGRYPEDYDEVREFFDGGLGTESEATTLDVFGEDES